jgi:hypothetical protein
MAKLTVENVFIVLDVARSKMSQNEFVVFLAKYEGKLYPLLHPYGYMGCQVTEQATLHDYDRAEGEWIKRVAAMADSPGATASVPPDPAAAEAEARQRMWATAANDPIAAVVIGLGAIFSATLGRLLGFEQDPVKATAAGQVTSNIVNTVGALNSPHVVNEMVRSGKVPQDRINTVEGDNVQKIGPSFGARNVNSGATPYLRANGTGINQVNCGQCTGAVLEGIGGTSSSFAMRARFPEGLTPTPFRLAQQFQDAGNYTGPIKQSSTMVDLFQQLKQYPVGTNLAVTYINPGGKDGHVICAFVGKQKELIFVDAQSKPPEVVAGPVPGATDFHFFPVTPKTR